MTQNRHNDLKTALYEHIKEKKPCDDLTLLTWLVSRLDEWVERWDGAFSCGRIEQTDFFGGLMVSIEVIDEVKSTSEFKPMFPEQEWMEFKNAVTWLEKTRDREEMSLVEKTYQEFRNRFAAISGQNSNDDRELGTQFDSKTSRTDLKQSVDQDGPSKIELGGPTQVEWWPPSNLLSPVELRTSRVFLSLAMLLLLASVFGFVHFLYQEWILVPAHFGALEGFRSSPVALARDTGNLSGWSFLLSAFFFAVWAVHRLWLQMRRKSQKST